MGSTIRDLAARVDELAAVCALLSDVQQTSDGGYVVTGSLTPHNTFASVFAAKLDSPDNRAGHGVTRMTVPGVHVVAIDSVKK